ncbi:ParB/RepB/Spo0J family partition protein [Chloroflexota bacterium]
MVEEIIEIRIDKICPNRRLIFDQDTIISTCCDIKLRGLMEPIVVELVGEGFRIIDGEKRWRACKKIGFTKIKAMIYEECGRVLGEKEIR